MQILRTNQQWLICLLLGASALVPAVAVKEVVALAGFLASDSAVYITGQVISVNGDMA